MTDLLGIWLWRFYDPGVIGVLPVVEPSVDILLL